MGRSGRWTGGLGPCLLCCSWFTNSPTFQLSHLVLRNGSWRLEADFRDRMMEVLTLGGAERKLSLFYGERSHWGDSSTWLRCLSFGSRLDTTYLKNQIPLDGQNILSNQEILWDSLAWPINVSVSFQDSFLQQDLNGWIEAKEVTAGERCTHWCFSFQVSCFLCCCSPDRFFGVMVAHMYCSNTA